jgi:hypothetical protein
MPVNLGVHSVAFHRYLVVTYSECGNGSDQKAVAQKGLDCFDDNEEFLEKLKKPEYQKYITCSPNHWHPILYKLLTSASIPIHSAFRTVESYQ